MNSITNSNIKPCWIIGEGLAGTENQCIAVAEHLDIPFDVHRVPLRFPWKQLSPHIPFRNSQSFNLDPTHPLITGPWPKLVIAAGRKAIEPCRFIKKRSPETYIVFLQTPRGAVKDPCFDLIAAPEHDNIEGDHIITTFGAPNRISESKIAEAKEQWRPIFEPLKSPRIAVLIGGESRDFRFDLTDAKSLIHYMDDWTDEFEDLSFMVTTSRRTGKEHANAIGGNAQEYGYFFYDGELCSDHPNPYFGMLAWADAAVVTEESASMLSDAASIGLPIYKYTMVQKHPFPKRIHRLHRKLEQQGALRDWHPLKFETWAYHPWNDAQMVAEEIQKRYINKTGEKLYG